MADRKRPEDTEADSQDVIQAGRGTTCPAGVWASHCHLSVIIILLLSITRLLKISSQVFERQGNMARSRLFVASALFFFLVQFAAHASDWRAEHLPFGVPKNLKGKPESLVVREAYCLSFNNQARIPSWVAYRIDPEDINSPILRTDNFSPDSSVQQFSPRDSDYKGSGFDRGHMAPAAAMKKNHSVMSQSFYYSNIAPQSARFNRGEWKSLESQIRDWLPSKKQLWVITGTGFINGQPIRTIGSGVSVPHIYWKVIVDEKPDGTLSGIAFVMPHENCGPFENYVTNIDQVEYGAFLDLFADLPDDVENRLESRVDPNDWPLGSKSRSVSSRYSPPQAKPAPQRKTTAVSPRVSQSGRVVTIAPHKGKKYHYDSNCRSLKKAKSTVSLSEEKAKDSGYGPCGICSK